MYRYLFLFLIIFFNCLNGLAETITNLSLEKALDIAFETNPEFQSKTLNLDIREAQIKTARAWSNPSILSDSGSAEDTYRIGISYDFELGGKRKKRTEISEAIFKTEVELLKVERLNFRNEIRQAYTQLYYKKKQLDILKAINENAAKFLDIANKREKAGDIPILEVSQVELTKLNTENQYDKTVYQTKEAHHQLEFLLNTKLDDNLELLAPNDLPNLLENISSDPIPEDKLIELALTNRPELEASKLSQEIINQKLKLAKAQRIPNLSVSAGPDFVTGDNASTGAFLITQMELPVFNRNHGEIEEAEAKQNQLILENQSTINKLKTQVEHAYLAYVFQREILNRYEEGILIKTKDVLDKSYRSFELGKSPISVSLKAQSDYMNVHLDYIQTLIDYQESISMLERALGVEL